MIKHYLAHLYVFITCFLIFSFHSKSQIANYSQYFNTQVYACPSFAGTGEAGRATLNNRKSPNLDGFRTFGFVFDWKSTKLNSGFAFMINRDEIGGRLMNVTNFGLAYNFHIKLNNDWHVRPGMNLTYNYQYVDYMNLVFSDQLYRYQINPMLGIQTPRETIFQSRGYLNSAASFLVNNNKYTFGFIVNNLTRPEKSFLKSDQKSDFEFILLGDIKFTWGNQPKNKTTMRNIVTTYMYRIANDKHQLDLAAYWSLPKFLKIGSGLRGIPVTGENKKIDALLLLMVLEWSNMQIGYSYDFALADFFNFQEISFVYEFK